MVCVVRVYAVYIYVCHRVCAAEPRAVLPLFNVFNFELFDSCIIHRLAAG